MTSINYVTVTQKVPKAKVNLNNNNSYRVVRKGKNDSKHDKVAKAWLKHMLRHERILSSHEYLSCNMPNLSKNYMSNIV